MRSSRPAPTRDGAHPGAGAIQRDRVGVRAAGGTLGPARRTTSALLALASSGGTPGTGRTLPQRPERCDPRTGGVELALRRHRRAVMPDERRPLTASFERFCACLNQFDADYVIVGSEAVAFHGVPRYSVDFGTFVLATAANLFRVKAALDRFGLPDLAAKIDPETWARSGATLRLGEPPAQIDILLQLSAVNYRTVAARTRKSIRRHSRQIHCARGLDQQQASRRPAQGSGGRHSARIRPRGVTIQAASSSGACDPGRPRPHASPAGCGRAEEPLDYTAASGDAPAGRYN